MASHQRNIPLGKFGYHVFLTHNWGREPWENHQRVSVVNAGLAKRGLKTWFDQNQIKGDIPRIMTRGVEDACVVVVFITEEYIRKVNSKDYDACKFEFDHAMVHKDQINMIPVLMERVPKPWKGPVGAVLGHQLYVDMTAGPTEETITELFNMIMHRIGEEVGPCPSPSPASAFSSSALPHTTPPVSTTPNPTSAVVDALQDSAVDELTTILSNAKLGDFERQALAKILREAGFDDLETILDMTEDHAKQMGIQPGHFIKISKAAKNQVSDSSTTAAATAPQQQVAPQQQPVAPVRQRGFKHGSVYLDDDDDDNTRIRWTRNTDTAPAPSWIPVQNPHQATNITRVEMEGSGIPRDDLTLFCEMLTFCPNIAYIDLESNNFGDEGAAAVAEALPALPKLTHLYLRGNQITAQGAKGLCRALPSLPLLQSLGLAVNNLGDEGAAAVAEALPALPKLTGLGLDGNQITAQGAKGLCRALPSLPLLQSLSLGGNNLGDEGAAAVAEALPALPKLTHFYIRGNQITAQGAKALCRALPSLPLLQQLGLGANKLGDQGVAGIVGGLRSMPSLRWVELNDNGASDEVKETARNTLSFVRILCL